MRIAERREDVKGFYLSLIRRFVNLTLMLKYRCMVANRAEVIIDQAKRNIREAGAAKRFTEDRERVLVRNQAEEARGLEEEKRRELAGAILVFQSCLSRLQVSLLVQKLYLATIKVKRLFGDIKAY